MTRFHPLIIMFLLVLLVPAPVRSEDTLIITSPGLTLLPASSLAALAVAIVQGADAVHIDAVLSKDDEVIVLGDPIINDITNAAERFPEKVRPDGNFYVFDFTAAELRMLSLSTSADGLNNGPGRTNVPPPHLQISSLEDGLALVRLQEKSLGRPIGVVIELKKGWLHQAEGKDLSRAVVDVLKQYGCTTVQSGCYLSTHDPKELQRIHDELFPAADMKLKLIQLIADNNSRAHMTGERGRFTPYNYDWMFTRFGLKGISAYADIIGIQPAVLIDESGTEVRDGYLADAHLLGMQVIIYPLDLSAGVLPVFAADNDALLDHYLFGLGLDGLLTRHGSLVRSYLAKRAEQDNISTQQQSIERLLENAEKNKAGVENLFLHPSNPL